MNYNNSKIDRRSLLKLGAVAVAAVPLSGLVNANGVANAADNPLKGSSATNMKGKKIQFAYSRVSGWPPSSAPETMWPKFQAYAKKKYGYDVGKITFAEAGFGDLFQKIAPTLASKSQQFNIMIVDSQWLGALSEPGWIVRADEVYKLNPEIDLKPYSSLVTNTYQVYPDGSGKRWGFPQMPDVQGVFLRKDLLAKPEEQAAFKAKYGKPLPVTYDDYKDIEMDDFLQVVEFFHRPDKNLYGTALMYAKDYDMFSCAYYPFAYSTGGKIWDPKKNNVYGILNTKVNADAMEKFVGLKKYQSPTFAQADIGAILDVFNTGKAFSAFQWLAVGAFMGSKKAGDPVMQKDVLAIPLPKFKGKIIGAMGGQPWVINAFNDADHMRVAVDFLKWWHTDAVQDDFILNNGGLPWTAAGCANPKYQGLFQIEAFKYMLAEGRSQDFWHLPEYAEMLAVQQEAFNGFATGQVKSAAHALEYAAAKQQQILYKAGRTKTKPPANVDSLTL